MRITLSLACAVFISAADIAGQKVGPDAVWQPKPADWQNMRAQCQAEQYPNYSKCLISKLQNAGAPESAIAFTKWLDEYGHGDFGWLTRYRKTGGPVGIAYVEYPIRANENQGWLFVNVNSEPPVIDPDTLAGLPETDMERNATYAALKQASPNVSLFPGDRSESAGPRIEQLNGNQMRIIVNYRLVQGCHACARVGIARFAFDFSEDGRFLGARFLDIQPVAQAQRK